MTFDLLFTQLSEWFFFLDKLKISWNSSILDHRFQVYLEGLGKHLPTRCNLELKIKTSLDIVVCSAKLTWVQQCRSECRDKFFAFLLFSLSCSCFSSFLTCIQAINKETRSEMCTKVQKVFEKNFWTNSFSNQSERFWSMKEFW